MKELNVQGIQNLGNLIDSLSDGNYSFHISTDSYQAQKPADKRYYIVEIADLRDNEQFIFDGDEHIDPIPSGMSKDY